MKQGFEFLLLAVQILHSFIYLEISNILKMGIWAFLITSSESVTSGSSCFKQMYNF